MSGECFMPGPLQNLRILDFSALLPGPFASMMLADMGADVLRIESPQRADLVRWMPPFANGVSRVHAQLNRNKDSLALDLKSEEGRAVIFRLLQDYDIVIEQFRPGVMQRLGLDEATLRQHCPGLIYCALTGYGQTGPYRDRAGHDLNYLAIAGALSYNGRRASGPQPMSVQFADLAGGSAHAVIALLAAVIHRQRTGEGQSIDISMTDAAFALQPLATPAALAGTDPGLETETLNGGGFYDCYVCADGAYLSVAALEPVFMHSFLTAIDRLDLSPLTLAHADADSVRRLKSGIAQTLLAQPRAHWLQVLAAVDACVEPVLSLQEAAQHPQLQARGMLVEVAQGETSLTQVASPLRFSRTPVAYRHAGKDLGADSLRILARLGYTAEALADWRRRGIIA